MVNFDVDTFKYTPAVMYNNSYTNNPKEVHITQYLLSMPTEKNIKIKMGSGFPNILN